MLYASRAATILRSVETHPATGGFVSPLRRATNPPTTQHTPVLHARIHTCVNLLRVFLLERLWLVDARVYVYACVNAGVCLCFKSNPDSALLYFEISCTLFILCKERRILQEKKIRCIKKVGDRDNVYMPFTVFFPEWTVQI